MLARLFLILTLLLPSLHAPASAAAACLAGGLAPGVVAVDEGHACGDACCCPPDACPCAGEAPATPPSPDPLLIPPLAQLPAIPPDEVGVPLPPAIPAPEPRPAASSTTSPVARAASVQALLCVWQT